MENSNLTPNQESNEDTLGDKKLTEITKPIPLFVQVANQLIEAIEAGQFPIGSFLPGENSLANKFGVSRPSVREALSCLQFEGYIVPRRGSGTQVISTTKHGRLTLSGTKGTKKFKYLDLLEARLLIEPSVVGLAASDPDPIALDSLQQIVEGMQLIVSGSQMHAHSDLAVHMALVRVCRNKFLVATAEKLLNVSDDSISLSAREKAWNQKALPHEWLGHHETIARAVMDHDSDKASAACTQHLISVLLNIEAVISLQNNDRDRISAIIERHK